MANTELSTLQGVQQLMGRDGVRKQFADALGGKAGTFMASVISVCRDGSLEGCKPQSVVAAALTAAALDLPVDRSLGFAAIVPYKNHGSKEAQFQIMAKGYVQLAERSGQYADMGANEVYEDELLNYNPITGKAQFVTDFSQCRDRESGDPAKIAGYYAFIELTTGFSKGLYMTRAEMEAHAQKYSKAYRYDLNNGKSSSLWTTNFDAMAEKTVLKRLISKYGVMSVGTPLAMAASEDMKVFDSDGRKGYLDNPQRGDDVPMESTGVTEDIVDIEAVVVESGEPVDGKGEEIFK